MTFKDKGCESMKKEIIVNLNEHHEYLCDCIIIARKNENHAARFKIIVPEGLRDKWLYIDFEKKSGKKIKTERIEINEEGIGYYDICNNLTDEVGRIKAEILFQDESGYTWISFTRPYQVVDSINATEEIEKENPNFISDAQKTLDHLNSIEKGKSATVKIGEVETLDATESAYVENVGDGTDVILNFGIPKGEPGTSESGGTSNYDELENLPNINGIELKGNKSLEELGIQPKGNYLTKIPDEYINEEELNDSIKDFATKEYVENEIATFDFIKVVEELPETGLENRVYFVPKADTQTQDLFDEYAWVNNKWEWITTKQIEVDLTDYVKNTDYATSTTVGLVKANGSSGISVSSVGDIGIVKATENDINTKTNNYKPIVPSNLEYAVKSVVGGHVTLTQAEYDALETKDENTYYYIKEEE